MALVTDCKGSEIMGNELTVDKCKQAKRLINNKEWQTTKKDRLL